MVPPLEHVLGRGAFPRGPVGEMGHGGLDASEDRATIARRQRLAQALAGMMMLGREVEHDPAQRVGIAIVELEISEMLGLGIEEPRVIAGREQDERFARRHGAA